MPRSFPPDVVVLDQESLVHARLGKGRKNPQVLQARSHRLGADTFREAVVTPELVNEASLADTLRRMKLEGGKWDKVSLLLPDSWFRINILEVPSLPDKPAEAAEAIRWSLKRTLPVPPESLRVASEVLAKSEAGVKVLIVSAIESTLATIERLFAAAGLDVVLIEPIGLNIWNAIAVREAVTTNDRLFLYVRENDFTTAVFRGAQPLFIRSRNLSGERSLLQEVRLSANYLRDTLSAGKLESCYVAGNRVEPGLSEALAEEFNTTVKTVSLRDVAEVAPGNIEAFEAELTACTGVFTG